MLRMGGGGGVACDTRTKWGVTDGKTGRWSGCESGRESGCESGRESGRERSPSKSKNAARTTGVDLEKIGTASAAAAATKTPLRMEAAAVRRERREKREEPPMHATMKVAKMKPKGGLLSDAVNEGVQLKTKMYIEPSKRETTAPRSGMRASRVQSDKTPRIEPTPSARPEPEGAP